MALYVDSAYLPDVERVCNKLELAGITTNPSILLAATQRGQQMSDLQVARALLDVCPGALFMQPTGTTTDDLWRLAERYLAIAPERIVLKLPITVEGMQVARRLRGSASRLAFTCVFTAAQAYCGALAGAQYVIPYFGRLRRAGDLGARDPGAARGDPDPGRARLLGGPARPAPALTVRPTR